MPVGSGQIIAGGDLSVAPLRFDGAGHVLPAPTYRKTEASAYLEYGLTPNISLIAAPVLDRQRGLPAINTVTGTDGSAFGARLGLYAADSRVLSVQALVQPPIGLGAVGAAGDLRVMAAQGFSVAGLPAFVDVEPGARVHAGQLPTEARLDLAFGIRPTPRLLVLVQDFSSYAPRAAGFAERTAYNKLQASLVYDLSATWSVQVGGFRTVAGRNAVRETGPLAAAWYRF